MFALKQVGKCSISSDAGKTLPSVKKCCCYCCCCRHFQFPFPWIVQTHWEGSWFRGLKHSTRVATLSCCDALTPLTMVRERQKLNTIDLLDTLMLAPSFFSNSFVFRCMSTEQEEKAEKVLVQTSLEIYFAINFWKVLQGKHKLTCCKSDHFSSGEKKNPTEIGVLRPCTTPWERTFKLNYSMTHVSWSCG